MQKLGVSGGVFPSPSRIPSDVPFCLGDAAQACFEWDTIDANAHQFKLQLPTGSGTEVPVFTIGVGHINVDLGIFNGIVQPTLAVVDLDRDSSVRLGWVADDRPAVEFTGSAGPLEILRGGNPLIVQNILSGASSQVLVVRGPDRAGAEAIGDNVYISLEQDTADGMTEVVRLVSTLRDVGAGTTDARFSVQVMTADALVEMLTIDSTAAGVITTTIPAGDVILNDNVSLRLGTGGTESDLQSDGTNTIWNLTSGILAIFGANTVLGSGEGLLVAAAGQTLRAPDIIVGGAGNIAGADLTIAAGIGTGTGDAGTVIFQLPIVAGAGDFIQTRATRLTLDMLASGTLLTMAAAQAMDITTAAGDLVFNPAGVIDFASNNLINIETTELNSITYTWPAADGGANDVLQTNGAGTLSWGLVGIAPVSAQYIVVALSGDLSAERRLQGTANQVILADGGANGDMVLSLPQSIHTGATPTFAALTLDGNLTFSVAAAIRAGSALADTLLLQARDVDGAVWTTFLTLTSANVPTADLAASVTIGSNAIAFSGGAFHDGFSDFVANEHIDHIGVTLTAGVGLSGGGDISVGRTFTVDLNELTTEVSIASGDFIAMVDITDSGSSKITFADLESTINHDSLAGFVSGEHFLQSAITTVGTITTGVWSATDVAVAAGGTGASTAATARVNLDLEIGVDVQAFDATLLSIAALGTAADRMLYTTGVDVWAETVLTATGRALIDDANTAAQRTTLGLVIGTDIQAFDAGLNSIAGLTTAADRMIYTTALDVYAVATLTAAGRALIDDANVATQRTTLGLGTFAVENLASVPLMTSSVAGAGDAFLPSGDNTGQIGNGANRWQLIRGVTITSGDFCFENGYRLTEANRVGRGEGIALVRPNGEVVNVWS